MRNPFNTAFGSFAILASMSLAACGGGAGSIPKAETNHYQIQQAPTSIAFTFPKAAATGSSSTSRRPSYVSSATQSATVQVTSYNGNATPSTPITVISTASGCTTNADGTKTCVVTANEPVGLDVFQVRTYISPDGSGPVLSQNSVSATITAAGPNNVSLTLNPIVAVLAWTPASASCVNGTACSGALALHPEDASGATIVGAGSFLTAAGAPNTITWTCDAHLNLINSLGSNTANGGHSGTTPANGSGNGLDIATVTYDGAVINGSSGGPLVCTATDTAGLSSSFTLTTSSSASVGFTAQ